MIAEDRKRVEGFVDQFKLAVISSDPKQWTRTMFPEWFTLPPESMQAEDYVEVDPDEVDLEDTRGEWKFVDESVTPQEAEAIIASMLANPSGRAGLEEMEQVEDGLSDAERAEGWR